MRRLSASGYLVCFFVLVWLEKHMLSHGAFVVLIDLVIYMTYYHNKYCDCCYRTACCACVCLFVYILFLL
jgi:hypothetical protein